MDSLGIVIIKGLLVSKDNKDSLGIVIKRNLILIKDYKLLKNKRIL